MAERWIVGVDGSDNSHAALRWAVANAPRAGARVTALTAVEVPPLMSVLAGPQNDGDSMQGADSGEPARGGASPDAEAPRRAVERRAVAGDPAQALVQEAATSSALIVGRRGSGRFRATVLGSVSRYCATHATVPVIVVPPGWVASEFRSVSVGFDGSPHARAALEWALRIAPPGVPVRVIAAIEPVPWLAPDLARTRFGDEVRFEEQRVLEHVDEIDPHRRAARHVVLHDPRRALVDAAAMSDLVVVGARGRGAVGAALLGSVSTWLLHRASCPVAIIPTDG